MIREAEIAILNHRKRNEKCKNLRKLVVAIDGPAASGKSTTARLVAERLGLVHVDTGAMYRAMTLKVLEAKVDPANPEVIEKLAHSTQIQLRLDKKQLHVILDGRDVTDQIRRREVTNAVSAISSIPKVRELMVREQRRMGEGGGIVLEGRDIGTVVFPGADVKFFMIANMDERVKRRHKDLQNQNMEVDIHTLRTEIERRDRIDSEREHSPLRMADDAVIVDTSALSIEEQVDLIVERVQQQMRLTPERSA